jgi:hypothetical protein
MLRGGRGAAAAVLGALPWLNPVAPGPSPQVQPWLVSFCCALALWMVSARSGALPRLRLALPVLALVAWAALSQGAMRPDVVFLAAGLLLIAISASFADEPGFPAGLQAGLLSAAALSGIIGLSQYVGLAPLLSPWVNAAEPGQAFANLRQPNQYATFCWLGLAVLVFGTLKLRIWLAATLALLLGAACAASVSRTGVLELVALAVLAAWWPGPERRRRVLLCALAAGAYAAATILLPALLEALTDGLAARRLWERLGTGEGCFSRMVLWSNVLHLIAQHPIAGWGWGELDFAHYATLYAGPRFCDILDNAHNLPLHLAVELGVPAALLVCGGALAWAWKERPWQETAPLRQLGWAMLALLVLHSLLEYPLWYGPFQLALGLCIGWLAQPRPAPTTGPLRVPRMTAAAVLMVATGYAAWDYARVSQIYLPPGERRAAWTDDTLRHVRRSWLFAGQARFADLTLETLTRANAAWMHAEANRALHYSPEPRVIERVIESAAALGMNDEAVLHLARYRAAFPRDYEAWRQRQRLPLPAD